MKKTLALLLLLAGLSVEAQGWTLTWNGSEYTMHWDKRTQNWLDKNGQEVSYQDDDSVIFRDSGSGKVMLLEMLEPSEVQVSNSVGHDYTFAYRGGLTGKMSLLKVGGGKLTIETSNYYTGETIISKGTLMLGNANALGSSRVTLNGASATLDLGTHTLSNNVTVSGTNASIGNGTIGGNVTVNDGKSVHFFGETKIDSNNEVGEGLVSYHGKIEAGGTTIQALHRPLESQIGAPVYPGLLQELSVSDGLIAGTDRQSSLAVGLEIESTANLMIKSMTITADNKISVGQNTITLNDVIIKISDDVCQMVNGIYTIDLKSLINCDLEMENVLLDASDLTLPQSFDPATTSVVFDFGGDVTIKQATGLDMRLGNYWSSSLNLDEQGKVIFTKLVDTPEPTTGTLGLLALAALAARRRKK